MPKFRNLHKNVPRAGLITDSKGKIAANHWGKSELKHQLQRTRASSPAGIGRQAELNLPADDDGFLSMNGAFSAEA